MDLNIRKEVSFVITNTCEECPYYRYDYSSDYPDEYVCFLAKKEITTQREMSEYESTLSMRRQLQTALEAYNASHPLFQIKSIDELPKDILKDMSVPVALYNPLTIPSWCPLPDYKENP